jgi:hypothetical protein
MESTMETIERLELLPGDGLTVNGVFISYASALDLLKAVVQPDTRRWFRFEREGNVVIVHVRYSEEEPHGTPTGTIGTPSPSAETSG